MDWGTQEVVRWLNEIGLSKYAKRFKGYSVNGAVLLQLDHALLDDLEIGDLNDREILLSESAKLNSTRNESGVLPTNSEAENYLHNTRVFDTPIITVSSFDDEDDDGSSKVTCDQEDLLLLSNRIYLPNGRHEPTSDTFNQRFIHLSYTDGEESTTDDGSERDFSFKDSDEEHDFDFYDEEKDTAVEAVPTASAVASRATQMVELLSQENVALREKLESVFSKMDNVEMLEFELESMRASYDELQVSTTKRENLETSMRARMETEMSKLQENNKHLRDELERSANEATQGKATLEKLRSDLKIKNDVIKQLITQSNSFVTARGDLERTIKQQKRHIEELQKDKEHLNSCLAQSREKVLHLEQELKPKETHTNHVMSTSKARAMHVTRRSSAPKSTCSVLDEHTRHHAHSNSTDEGIAELDGPTSVPVLLEILREKDERIQTLESDMLQLEQTFMQENTSRQLAIRAASMPKEARIAALEKSSQESEKIIAECRGQNLKYIEELYVANRRCADLEAIIKSLYSQLAEKNLQLRTLHHNNDDDENDEPNEPEWPSDPVFSRTDFAHMKELARDLADVESLDSGMSVTNATDVRQMDSEIKTMDEPDQMSVHFWSV